MTTIVPEYVIYCKTDQGWSEATRARSLRGVRSKDPALTECRQVQRERLRARCGLPCAEATRDALASDLRKSGQRFRRRLPWKLRKGA